MDNKETVLKKPSRPLKKMAVFRSADAKDLGHEMPVEGVDAGVEAGFAKIMAGGTPIEAGATGSLLFREIGEHGLSLGVVWFKSGFILPRHSHDCDCLYYPVDVKRRQFEDPVPGSTHRILGYDAGGTGHGRGQRGHPLSTGR